ncbi:hypothetical protein JW879_08540 [candidate division WOR-3 bacterium]|nr:hypothetical protein [candidate division WOR-3 bacterium]
MYLKKLIIFAAVISILIPGCKLFELSGPSIEELLDAPEQIEIDDREYILETYLWRDFMPVSPPDGQPLIALIWVTAIDSLAFPSSIDANRLYIVNDEQLWETEFSDEDRPVNPSREHQLEKIARDGPKWGPNIQVEVIVKVVDGENNTYLLRASDQWIHRTD